MKNQTYTFIFSKSLHFAVAQISDQGAVNKTVIGLIGQINLEFFDRAINNRLVNTNLPKPIQIRREQYCILSGFQ